MVFFHIVKARPLHSILCEGFFFLQNIYPKHSFRFSRGEGGQLKYIFKFVLSLCNKISTSTFDLRFALLVPPQSENASYAPVNKMFF